MLFDFQCPNGHLFERNVPSSTRTVQCGQCTSEAERLISVPTLKIPFDGSYPGSALKWAKYHEKMAKVSTEN